MDFLAYTELFNSDSAPNQMHELQQLKQSTYPQRFFHSDPHIVSLVHPLRYVFDTVIFTLDLAVTAGLGFINAFITLLNSTHSSHLSPPDKMVINEVGNNYYDMLDFVAK